MILSYISDLGRFLHCKAFFYPKRDICKGNTEHLLFLSSSLFLFSAVKPTEEFGVLRTDAVETAKKMFQFCLPKLFKV